MRVKRGADANTTWLSEMTEPQRPKAGLQESEAHYRRIVEMAKEGIWLIDKKGRTTYVNQSMAEMLGYTVEEMIGRSTFDFLFEEDHAQAGKLIEPQQGVGEKVDIRLRRNDGSELWTLSTVTALWGDKGELLGALAMITDVTERKLAQAERERLLEQLETKQRLLQAVLEQMPAGLLIIEAPSGKPIFSNEQAARISDISFRALANVESYAEYRGHHPDGRPYQPEEWPLTRSMRSGEVVKEEEIELLRADGSRVTLQINAAPIRDADGRIMAAVAGFTDITERRHLEEHLRQSHKMEAIGKLAGGVAHDFNNMLTAIIGYSELVMNQLDEHNPLRKHIEEILKVGGRAISLTNQLLAFSRRQVLQPKVLDLNAVVGNMHQLLRRLIGEHIELVTVFGSGLGRVKADPSQFEQVILNLAVNARDAMPQGGKLVIETANVELDDACASRYAHVKPGQYVMLAISDTGQGIDKDKQSRIFEPFFTTKGLGKGTGLGLPMVYGIVKQSGGSIWVQSEPGQGTAFKIYLPMVEQSTEVLDPIALSATLARGWETILLAEDEDVVRNLVREILQMHGYRVLEAHHGTEALRIALQHMGEIHLLLTDVVMPQMGGKLLAQRLASLRPATRVLYMSGYTDSAIAHNGMLEPGTAFIQKPFTLEALARKVRQVLDAS